MLLGGSIFSASTFAEGNIPESARTALYVNTYYFQSEDRFENTETVLEFVSLEKNKETVCVDSSLADKCYVQGVVMDELPLIPLVIHWYYNENDGQFITSMNQYGDLIPVAKNWFYNDSDNDDIIVLVGSRYAIPSMW